jgi:ABC-type sugar transport system ATPase subunit
MANLVLEDVKKSFGLIEVVKGVNLDVARANSSSSSAPRAAANPRCCG